MNELEKKEFEWIMAWLEAHSNNKDVMDHVNQMTFQFTTKFRMWKTQQKLKEIDNQ